MIENPVFDENPDGNPFADTNANPPDPPKPKPMPAPPKGPTYNWTQQFLFGLADGLATDFDWYCADAMYGLIEGGFGISSHLKVYEPRHAVKFRLSLVRATEALNSAYVFCDFNTLWRHFAMLFDWSDWTNYLPIASRLAGSLFFQVPFYSRCIKQANSIEEGGYTAGVCWGHLAAVFLDAHL